MVVFRVGLVKWETLVLEVNEETLLTEKEA